MNAEIDFGEWLSRVRRERPLVHGIFGPVVAGRVADALLAVGASPVMARAPEEVADVARGAGAVTLSLGMLDAQSLAAMLAAGQAAGGAGVPVVFDPVGVGATAYRAEAAARLAAQLRLAVLRGNRGEIGWMLGTGGRVRGVDAVTGGAGLEAAMQAWARSRASVVVATGAVDLVADGTRVLRLGNGDPVLAAVAGTGCQLTALIGAWIAVAGPRPALARVAEAAAAAITSFNVAAELAREVARGPGSFPAALLDALWDLTGERVARRARVEILQV